EHDMRLMMQGLTDDAAFRNPTHPPGHSHRQQAPRPGARIGVLLDQYRDRQPQHRDQGHYKAPSPKHLPDYLGAFCWTTNHRKNMRGMISAACRAIATSTALTRKTVYAPPVGAIG